MDSDQRLQDLPKAYADIILNASKEAAAKVMAAERKAQRLEQELQFTKDNAVQMMDRLKKLMDDKIIEAKMTCWNQNQKINVLEAQLQEAEDIVSDLREKLKYVKAKCERVSRNDVQHLDKHDNATLQEAFKDNRQSQCLPCDPMILEKNSLVASDKENLYQNQRTEYLKCFREAIQMRNLCSTMPELPSILRRSKEHKVYRNRCTQRIQASEKNILDSELSLSRQLNDASGKEKVEGARKDASTCKITTDETQNIFNIASKEAVCKDDCLSCRYEVQAIDLILKTANTKYRKKKDALNKKIPEKLFRKLHETPGVPQSGPGLVPVEKSAQTPGDLLGPILQEAPSAECLDIQVCKSNVNKVNESIPPAELKTIDATSKGSSQLQLFKYTFQRKRKRETMRISDGNVSSKNFTPERKKEMQNISAEQEKSSSAAE